MHITIVHRVNGKPVGCYVSTYESVELARDVAKLCGYDVIEVRPTTEDDYAWCHYVYMLGDEDY